MLIWCSKQQRERCQTFFWCIKACAVRCLIRSNILHPLTATLSILIRGRFKSSSDKQISHRVLALTEKSSYAEGPRYYFTKQTENPHKEMKDGPCRPLHRNHCPCTLIGFINISRSTRNQPGYSRSAWVSVLIHTNSSLTLFINILLPFSILIKEKLHREGK